MRLSAGSLPRGFGIIWSAVAVDVVSFGIVVPILPLYAERFGVSVTVVGLLFASFSLAQFVCAPLLGRLSDRVGRKPMILVSLFGTALGSLLTGLAGSVWILFLGRVVDGASGASVSVAQAAVADIAPEHDRARLMGLLGAAFGVGFVVGPAIGALAALAGPHVPFLVAAAIAAANALVAIRRLPETNPSRVRVPPGTLTSVQAPAPEHPVQASAPVPSDAEGRADRAPVPATRELMRLVTLAFAGMAAFSGFEATFALLADRRLGIGLSAIALVFSVIGLALVTVQVGLVGPLTRRLGETGALRAALSANAAGLALLALDAGWAGLVPAVALLVLGQGLLAPTLSSAIAGRAGSERGTWLGWQQSATGLARVVGPVLAGALFEQVGVGTPYLVGAVLVLVALSLVPGRGRRSGSPGQTTAGWQGVEGAG